MESLEPGDDCPRCGSEMEEVDEGVERCEKCGHTRSDHRRF